MTFQPIPFPTEDELNATGDQGYHIPLTSLFILPRGVHPRTGEIHYDVWDSCQAEESDPDPTYENLPYGELKGVLTDSLPLTFK